MREKIWKVKNKITAEEFENLGEEKFSEKVEERLLDSHGLEGEEKEEFLNPRHPSELPPETFGLTDEVLENAASVIFSAIREERPIIIHGDFDADGVCATAILWQAIYRGVGYKKCLPFIPDRFNQGYGMSEESLGAVAELLEDKGFCDSSELADCQADSLSSCLLITVDCGITAAKEIKIARDMGWDVLVTDHHQKKDGNKGLEDAEGVVWTDKICGAGIAYVLARKLANPKSNPPAGGPSSKGESDTGPVILEDPSDDSRPFRRPRSAGRPAEAAGISVAEETLSHRPAGSLQSDRGLEFINNLLGLAALATAADVMPLLGPNRSFVKYGLEVLNERPSLGMQKLMKVAGVEQGNVQTYELGWVLAPRINAAGRLSSAIDAVRLLCTENPKRAQKLAKKLDSLNRERQNKTKYMVELAQETAHKMYEEHKFLVVSNSEFHEGIIGLIAGKLTREYYLPTVAISEGSEFSKGSARSVSGFNIVEVLRELEDILEGVGGHPMAAGFTIRTERISEFRESLLARAEELLAEKELKPTLYIDFSIPLESVDWDLWEVVEKFKPFGEANACPLFCSHAGVVDIATVGRTNSHLKLKLTPLNIGENPVQNLRKSHLSAIGFGMGELTSSLRLGDKVAVTYSLLENKWNGNRTLELKLKDIRKVEE